MRDARPWGLMPDWEQAAEFTRIELELRASGRRDGDEKAVEQAREYTNAKLLEVFGNLWAEVNAHRWDRLWGAHKRFVDASLDLQIVRDELLTRLEK